MAHGERVALMGWVVVVEWEDDEPVRLALETEAGEEVELELDEDAWEIGQYIDSFVEVEGRVTEDEEGVLSMRVSSFGPVDLDEDEDEDDEDDDEDA